MVGGSNILGSGFHFQVALGQHLWNDLFSAALPVQVGGGDFDLTAQTASAFGLLEKQLGNQIKLLSDRTQPLLPPPIQDIKTRWSPKIRQRLRSQRNRLAKKVKESVKVDGQWKLHVTKDGTSFQYRPNGVSVSAQIKAVAEGHINLRGRQEPIPFSLEKLVRGSFDLCEVHYNGGQKHLQGSLRNLHLELGQNAAVKMAEKWIDKALAAKLGNFNPVPMLKVSQINESLGQALGNLQMAASIDDVAVDISENQLVLKLNFAFQRM